LDNKVMAKMFLQAPELGTQVTEVPLGGTASLRCNSNDDQHNFLFWQLGQNQIIGPGNEYDHVKYKYEVLSGRLLIKGVTPSETGYYRCVSKNIEKGNLNIGAVEMIVKGSGEKFQRIQTEIVENDDMEIVKIICIVISLIVLITCAVVFYKLKADEKRRKARLMMLAEDDDDEGSGDEIYNRTTTIINENAPGPSAAPVEHITGIDNRGLDDDFNSVFEQISINVANRQNFI